MIMQKPIIIYYHKNVASQLTVSVLDHAINIFNAYAGKMVQHKKEEIQAIHLAPC